MLVLFASVSCSAAKMPNLIKIDGVPWGIKLVEQKQMDDKSYIGQTECGAREIFILKSLNGYDRAETVIHEVLHAFTCDFGLVHNEKLNNLVDDDCDGHCGIYYLAPKLQKFMRENTELMRWIMDEDPPPINDPLPQDRSPKIPLHY